MDRMPTALCHLGPGQWAAGRWAREIDLLNPGLALGPGCLWLGPQGSKEINCPVPDGDNGLEGLSHFLKYLYRSATRGMGVDVPLVLVYRDPAHRRWLERAAALAGLPLAPGGFISREDALLAGLARRGLLNEPGPVGVLDMGGSSCTLYKLQREGGPGDTGPQAAAGELLWQGDFPWGSSAHLACVLAQGLFPGQALPGLAPGLEQLLEDVIFAQRQGQWALRDPLEVFVAGERALSVTPEKVLDIIGSHFHINGAQTPGAHVAGCAPGAECVPYRLVLVGGVADLGLGVGFFDTPLVVPEGPELVEIEGAAVLAQTHRQPLPAAQGQWEKKVQELKRLCQDARQEAELWQGACQRAREENFRAGEQLSLRESQVEQLASQVEDLRGQLADMHISLEEANSRAKKMGGPAGAPGFCRARAMAAGAGPPEELERMRRRCQHLEKKIRQMKDSKTS